MTPKAAMKEVFKIMGTKSAVAALCGVTPQAVSRWKEIPIRHCGRLETAVEGKISCRQMRPDFGWPAK